MMIIVYSSHLKEIIITLSLSREKFFSDSVFQYFINIYLAKVKYTNLHWLRSQRSHQSLQGEFSFDLARFDFLVQI